MLAELVASGVRDRVGSVEPFRRLAPRLNVVAEPVTEARRLPSNYPEAIELGRRLRLAALARQQGS